MANNAICGHTYEDLKQVNSEIKTTDVKGKDYAEVPQRINAFRKLYPNGCISTEIVSLEGDVCIIKATVLDDTGRILGTGTAYEKEGSSFINKTSYIENCETSAVGRALGMCGIGIDTSVASAEEVANAIAQQEEQKKTENSKISEVKVQALLTRCQNEDVDPHKILALYKVNSFAELTEKKFANIAANWSKIKEQ